MNTLLNNTNSRTDFKYGLKKGIPIALGYIPVSFTFGLQAVKGGIPIWLAIFISLSNVTSAGQFAGTNLIIAGANYFEITLTTFIINLRYMLMSLSLSQKINTNIPLIKRLIFGFGITDETFLVASMETGKLSYHFLLGLITGPIIGWTLGTSLGAFISSSLPISISNAMGIALYAMFIAIIVPPSKQSKPVFLVVVLSVIVTCILKYLPMLSCISSGFRIILTTCIVAGIVAYLFPVKEEAL